MLQVKPVFLSGNRSYKPRLGEYVFKYVYSPIHIFADWFSIKISDHVTVVSHQARREFMRDYAVPSWKISIIHNGVDLEKFNPDISGYSIRTKYSMQSSPIVLYVGVFRILKRVHNLLYAMEEVVNKLPDAKLLVVGGGRGYEGELIRLTESLNLQENVVFVGKVPNDAIPEYYAAADVIAIPSSYEGLPVVLLEAMGMGKPVVSTNVSGMPDVIVDGETGFLIEKDNIEQLAEKIIYLLENNEARKEMGMSARKRAEEHFDWAKIAKQYEAIYRSFAGL